MTLPRLSKMALPVPPEGHEDLVKYLTGWAKRFIVLITFLSLIVSGFALFGFHGPQLDSRLTVVEDSIQAHSALLSDLKRLVNANVYISCQTLSLMQSSAIQKEPTLTPQECK